MLHFYHRPDDPWSYLLAQLLPGVLQAYDVGITCTTMPFPARDYAPRPELLSAHALRDAVDLQRHCDLVFDSNGRLPAQDAVDLACRRLLTAGDGVAYLALACELSAALFSGDSARLHRLCAAGPLAAPADAAAQLAAHQARQYDAGHFHTGMVSFQGNWYWGVDRLAHLEHDLLVAGRRRPGASVGLLRRKPLPPLATARAADEAAPVVDFFCTFRSPYAYVGAARSFDLQRRYPIRVRPRLVLPMKMVGYVIPELKARYFRFDPAREALRHGVRFGNFHDPFGPGLERAMALADAAEAAGRLEPYILSVMEAVWADGIDLAQDAGLRSVAERAGLDWATARPHLEDDRWRYWAMANREELESIGQYAAPTYRMGDYVTWGQDRIWMLEQHIRQQLGLEPSIP